MCLFFPLELGTTPPIVLHKDSTIAELHEPHNIRKPGVSTLRATRLLQRSSDGRIRRLKSGVVISCTMAFISK